MTSDTAIQQALLERQAREQRAASITAVTRLVLAAALGLILLVVAESEGFQRALVLLSTN